MEPGLMDEIVVNSRKGLEEMHQLIDALFQQHRYLRITIKTGKQRSKKQNKAMHLYFRMLSEELNEHGIDMIKFLGLGIDIPWDREGKMAKEHVWRPVQEVITGCESTTEPEKHEYPMIYEAINRKTTSEFGIYVPWPCKETQDAAE